MDVVKGRMQSIGLCGMWVENQFENYVEPVESNVRLGVQYGFGGVARTGLLAVPNDEVPTEPIEHPVETVLRQGITRVLRAARLRVDDRELNVRTSVTLDQIKGSELPMCLIGEPEVRSEIPISRDTLEYRANVSMMFVVARGARDADAANSIAEMKHRVGHVLRNSTALGMDGAYGVFSYSVEINKGDVDYESEIGIAAEYVADVTGYYQQAAEIP